MLTICGGYMRARYAWQVEKGTRSSVAEVKRGGGACSIEISGRLFAGEKGEGSRRGGTTDSSSLGFVAFWFTALVPLSLSGCLHKIDMSGRRTEEFIYYFCRAILYRAQLR